MQTVHGAIYSRGRGYDGLKHAGDDESVGEKKWGSAGDEGAGGAKHLVALLTPGGCASSHPGLLLKFILHLPELPRVLLCSAEGGSQRGGDVSEGNMRLMLEV